MMQLSPHQTRRLPEGAMALVPPAAMPAQPPDEASVEAALLLARLQLSLGQSPQIDEAMGQLLSLLA
jgi:hypothetical protein